MKNLLPLQIGLSDIVSTNITITESAWFVGSTYALGAQVYKGIFIYESAIAGNIGNNPELTSGGVNINNDWLNAGFTPIAVPKWLIVGMINKMRAFDGYVTTYTSNSLAIDYTIKKEYVAEIYFIGIDAATIQAQVLDSTGVVLWDSGPVSLYAGLDLVDNYYDWFFTPPPEPRSTILIKLGIITGSTEKLRILLSGPGTVKLGKVCCGSSTYVGSVQWGLEDGIIDFSKNTLDDFGEAFLKQGRYVPEIIATAKIKTIAESDSIIKLLDRRRATACVWDMNEGEATYQSLICYGVLSERKRSLSGPNNTVIKFKVTGSV